MIALIDWSYDLLTPREQRFFESLSVFADGCTLDAATAVCATEAEADLDEIDLVASLASKSLLVAELVGNEQRYRLLESSRQYASAKLIARGEQAAFSGATRCSMWNWRNNWRESGLRCLIASGFPRPPGNWELADAA